MGPLPDDIGNRTSLGHTDENQWHRLRTKENRMSNRPVHEMKITIHPNATIY